MKKITAIGQKEEGKNYRMVNESVYLSDLNSLPSGYYKHTIEKQHRKASNEQFGYLYAVVYPLSMVALNSAGYEFTGIDQVDIFWKELFANKEVLNRETGEIMKLPLSKSEFKTVDEMAYCDAIRNYVSEYLNSFIPDPNPNYKNEIH
jgi:hypothetical protein